MGGGSIASRPKGLGKLIELSERSRFFCNTQKTQVVVLGPVTGPTTTEPLSFVIANNDEAIGKFQNHNLRV